MSIEARIKKLRKEIGILDGKIKQLEKRIKLMANLPEINLIKGERHDYGRNKKGKSH